VLLTTYLNWGCAGDVPVDDVGVVSFTSSPRMLLIMLVFHASVSGWEYDVTPARAASHAYRVHS